MITEENNQSWKEILYELHQFNGKNPMKFKDIPFNKNKKEDMQLLDTLRDLEDYGFIELNQQHWLGYSLIEARIDTKGKDYFKKNEDIPFSDSGKTGQNINITGHGNILAIGKNISQSIKNQNISPEIAQELRNLAEAIKNAENDQSKLIESLSDGAKSVFWNLVSATLLGLPRLLANS